MKKSELRIFLGLAFLTASVFWMVLGRSWEGSIVGLAFAATIYSLFSIYRLRRISQWISSQSSHEPPAGFGEYGDVLDALYRAEKSKAKEIEAAKQGMLHLQNSFTSLEEAVVLLNGNGEIDWSNQAAERLLGLLDPGDRGRSLTNLLRHPEFLHYYDEGEYERPLSMPSPLADNWHLEVSITWFAESNRMVFVRNVTDVRRLEQIRTDFISNVSHELRTPLTVIAGYLEAMQDSESEWHAAILQMCSQADRMESLLTDLTQLSKLESVPESMQHEAIEVRPMISMIFDGISVQKPEQILEIKNKTDARLLGNREEIYSAFSNLIHNASKYSGATGKVVVSWRQDATGASLAVRDNGQGIEAQHLPRLTERFYRADPGRHSSTGGTGLGLAIVKHVLLRHQAALNIESTPGEGSTFTCIFPEERVITSKN